MSLTVNAPFLKFYNLCYLINQSTGCNVGSDNGLGGRSHETLTWAEKGRSLATSPCSVCHPAKNHQLKFSISIAGILLPAPKISPHKHERLWLFPTVTRHFRPIDVDTHELYPGLSVLEDSPFSSREGSRTQSFESQLQPMVNPRKCRGGWGMLLFACANVPVRLRPSQTSGKGHGVSQSRSRGGLLESGVSRSAVVLGRGCGSRRRAVLICPGHST